MTFLYPPAGAVTVDTAGLATEPKQDTQITLATATNTKLDTVIANQADDATAARQDTGNASLSSIDIKLTDNATSTLQTAGNASLTTIAAKDFSTETTLSALNAKVTAVNTGAVVVSSSALPTGAATEATLDALSDKSASALINVPYDYQAITYIGATTDIDTVVFKSGGAGGTTVGTLTMGYDGSNRLTSVTKS